ncbi:Peroxisomal acyl-coenzyme A oxidase 1 [Curvularia clavata]|uniref:Acyl-coenzyme A oxidase n=1 Tax=Curvularia clavata TaxID=95742 RepID=A0A9Q9DU56_CURCL|nr:Peroxisomal acyl-coenzyme A oxidase 1 [Curvularia clavata]
MAVNAQTVLMRKARDAVTFPVAELTSMFWGGDAEVRERRAAFERVEKVLGTHDTTKLPRCYTTTSRQDIFLQGLKMGKACLDDMVAYNHGQFIWVTPRYDLTNASPFGHKAILFEPAIEHNGTPEQKAFWLPLARSGQILGTYTQTELGHGSFVRGIETTATFDMATDEFVIHSPTVTSKKFWPAGLGFSTTHAAVMARLIVGDKDYGPHIFLVQLRSLEDGTPMQGIRMGDAGLKYGYNEADNGFASFDHVRIPRSHMLMAHSQLARDGTFTTESLGSKLSYSVMLLVRSKMPAVFTLKLAQALTIATRYSVVRQQGLGPAGFESEAAIMQYKHQHFRLLTLIAKVYAMSYASGACGAQYSKMRQMQEKGDHSLLQSVHVLTAGLKAYVTSEAVDGAEEARKMCGGHGYMNISGLPDIIGSIAGSATFEGENYVLWQQVARHLLKQMDCLLADDLLEPNTQYLADMDDPNYPYLTDCIGLDDHDTHVEIFRHRARRLIAKAYTAVRTSSKTPEDAWNEHMMLLISASRAHIEYFIVKVSVDYVTNLPDHTNDILRWVLKAVVGLFPLSTIVNPRSVDAQSFIVTNNGIPYLSPGHLTEINNEVNELLEFLLPEAIGLTDAWDFSDASLCSAIGMRDGDIYENIMRWVEQMPINQDTWENNGVPDGWKEYVNPVLRRELSRKPKL